MTTLFVRKEDYMIVSINKNNSDSYLNLFTDAYRFLKAIDEKEGTNYVDPNKERFASLAEYYGHMADLFDTFAYQYVMTPLDEEPFHIDLNKREINKLLGKVKQDGYSLVPISLYFKGSFVKLELGLGKGKKLYDKRQDIAKKDAERRMQKALKAH